MRLLGTLAQSEHARLLADHLLTLGIDTKLAEESTGTEVWVKDEDRLPAARQEFQCFLANPSDPRFRAARQQADKIRRQQARDELTFQLNFHDKKRLWHRPGPASTPLTLLLIAASITISFLAGTLIGAGDRDAILNQLTFTNVLWVDQFGKPISPEILEELRRPLGIPGERVPTRRQHTTEALRSGEVWRLLTPIFLHFGFIHLMFNMYALYSFGGLLERSRGGTWLVLFVLVSGICSNVAQHLYPHAFEFVQLRQGSTVFGGMSGVLYSMFGYLWMKTRFDYDPKLHLPPDLIAMMLIWMFVCMTGLVGPIANTAHVAGLAVGSLWAVVGWQIKGRVGRR
jgi:GlpG protein